MRSGVGGSKVEAVGCYGSTRLFREVITVF